jgi:hypothetical protein
MDTIDITNADFSLTNTEWVSDSFSVGDIPFYIWIVIAIIFIIASYLIYNYYAKYNKKVTFHDKSDECYDDVCPR